MTSQRMANPDHPKVKKGTVTSTGTSTEPRPAAEKMRSPVTSPSNKAKKPPVASPPSKGAPEEAKAALHAPIGAPSSTKQTSEASSFPPQPPFSMPPSNMIAPPSGFYPPQNGQHHHPSGFAPHPLSPPHHPAPPPEGYYMPPPSSSPSPFSSPPHRQPMPYNPAMGENEMKPTPYPPANPAVRLPVHMPPHGMVPPSPRGNTAPEEPMGHAAPPPPANAHHHSHHPPQHPSAPPPPPTGLQQGPPAPPQTMQYDFYGSLDHALAVAWQFIPQYYSLRARHSAAAIGFYSDASILTIDSDAVTGTEAIRNLIRAHRFDMTETIVTSLAAQHVINSVNGGILLTCHGKIVTKHHYNKRDSPQKMPQMPSRRFVQTFLLVPQMTGYFILQDLLMTQPMVPSNGNNTATNNANNGTAMHPPPHQNGPFAFPSHYAGGQQPPMRYMLQANYVSPPTQEAAPPPAASRLPSPTPSKKQPEEEEEEEEEEEGDHLSARVTTATSPSRSMIVSECDSFVSHTPSQPPAPKQKNKVDKEEGLAPSPTLSSSLKMTGVPPLPVHMKGGPSATSASFAAAAISQLEEPPTSRLRAPADGVIPPSHEKGETPFQAVSRASPTSSTGGIAGSDMADLNLGKSSSGRPFSQRSHPSAGQEQDGMKRSSLSEGGLSRGDSASQTGSIAAPPTDMASVLSNDGRSEQEFERDANVMLSPKPLAPSSPKKPEPTSPKKAAASKGPTSPPPVKDIASSAPKKEQSEKESKKDVKKEVEVKKEEVSKEETKPAKPSSWAALASSGAEKWNTVAVSQTRAAVVPKPAEPSKPTESDSKETGKEKAPKKRPASGQERPGTHFSYDVMIKDVPTHIDPREIQKGFAFLGETPEIDMVRTKSMVFLKYRLAAAANRAVSSRITIGSIVLQCEEKVKRNLVPDHPHRNYNPNYNPNAPRPTGPPVASAQAKSAPKRK